MSSSDRECPKCGGVDRYSDGHCRECAKARAKTRYNSDPKRFNAIAAEWKRDNRERSRVSGRKGGRTDWAPGEHERAVEALPSVKCCECCGSPDPRHVRGWNADHDHSSGRFRGFVCHPCNIAISHVEKFSLDRGAQIALYLKRHAQ